MKPRKYRIYAVRRSFGETVVGACWWWLRSPVYYSEGAAYVNRDGYVNYGGYYVDCDYDCVCPVVVALP